MEVETGFDRAGEPGRFILPAYLALDYLIDLGLADLLGAFGLFG